MLVRVIVLFIFIPVIAFSFTIKGRVYRGDTREALTTAAIFIKQGTNIIETARADESGFFTADGLAGGEYTIDVLNGGFYSESKTLTLTGERRFNFYLVPQSTGNLGELTVTAEKLKGTESKNTVSRIMREKSPVSLLGDPVSPITKMPGVTDLGAGNMQNNTKLSVRGGTGNENLAFLDEALIPNPYHHFIGDSVFIDDLVENISLYKGVLPARYGGALSSLLEVGSVETKPGFHGKAVLGLLNASLSVHGSTEDQKWSYAGGIRRTHYDLLLPLFLQGDMTNLHIPYYIDSHGRIAYQTASDQFAFIWQASLEPMSYSNVSSSGKPATNYGEINYSSAVAHLNWKHIFTRELYLEQALSGAYSLMSFLMLEPDNKTILRSEQKDLRYRALLGVSPLENLSFRVGGEVNYFPSLKHTNSVDSFVTNQITGQPEWMSFGSSSFEGKMTVASLFAENTIELFNKFVYIEDSIRFSWVDKINKTSLDPRLTVGIRPDAKTKVYLSGGYLSQFPTDTWSIQLLDMNKNLEVPGCWHAVAGTKLSFFDNYELTGETYYKQYVHMISLESNHVFRYDTSSEEKRVFGAELLLTRKPDQIPLYGWLSFGSYYVQGYRNEGFDPNMLYNLNPGSLSGGPSVMVAGQFSTAPLQQWFNGDSVLYKFNLTAVWDITKQFSLTSEFQWTAGAFYTPLKSVQTNVYGPYTLFTPVWETYNSARLPDNHFLNLKLEYTGLLFDMPAGAFLQVNNVYNYRPVTYISYSENYSKKTENQSPIGIYPTLGVWMKW